MSVIQAPRLTTGLKSLDVLGLFRPTNPILLKAPRRILNGLEHRLILSALKNGGTAAIVSGARPGMAKLESFGDA